MSIADQYNEVLQRIQQCVAKLKLDNHVGVLAVTKGHPLQAVQTLYACGQRAFGESYVQEATDKIKAMPKDCIWHFIGRIQSNKIAMIAEKFSWVDSVCDLKTAQRLNEACKSLGKKINICLQVNISNSPNKAGGALESLEPLINQIIPLEHITLRGLMAIPDKTETFDAQCEPYARLKKAYDHLNQQSYGLDTLSMGMSNDYEAAICMGATQVRIGQAILGARH